MKARTYSVSPSAGGFNRRADDAREERIEALNALVAQAMAEGDSNEFRRLSRELKAAVLGRSPGQLARMRRLAPEGKA